MDYPIHIYEPIRAEIAVTYIQHELRKLFWRLDQTDFKKIDKDVAEWMSSPQLNTPRDFWNGLHGISQGFKLKNIIYYLTAENIVWTKELFPVESLWFGVELSQTKVVGDGRLPAKKVADYYLKPENKTQNLIQRQISNQFSYDTNTLRDEDPLIVIEKLEGEELVNSVYDGNGRLAKAIMNGKQNITVYIGKFKTDLKKPLNFWIPTGTIMDILFFVYQSIDNHDEKLFRCYIEILKHIISQSETARFELKNRAVTAKQPHRDSILTALSLI